MTEKDFGEQLRAKTQRAIEKDSQKTWWDTFAPQLIKASEDGSDHLDVFEKLSPVHVDFCIAKGLKVEKTPRHFDAKLKDAPWYVISWGTK